MAQKAEMQGKSSIKDKLGSITSLFTVIGALSALIVFFSLTSPYFLSVKNFLNIGMYAAIIGCVCCSVTFVNIAGMMDISIGSQVAVVGMVVAVASRAEIAWPLIIVLGLLTGMACGSVNGFLVTVFKLNAFITTIATMQTLRGVAYLISNGIILYALTQSGGASRD